MTETCEKCAGKRHVSRQGRWQACDCLLAARARRLWRLAKIPKRHDGETWRSFLKRFWPTPSRELIEITKGLRAGSGGYEIVLQGDVEGREVAASLLLRDAITGGASAEILDLPGLINYEFSREERTSDPYTLGAVAVRLGGEPRHPRNRTVLEKLLSIRRDSQLPTVLISSDAAGSAGELGSSGSAGEIRRRFDHFEVRVR